MKTITLKQTGYYITGVSDVTPWGGGNACICMKPFRIALPFDKITDKMLLDSINDNGFGVESINGAICDVFEEYEGQGERIHINPENRIVGTVSQNTQDYYYNN
jgi:hypothetical protein